MEFKRNFNWVFYPVFFKWFFKWFFILICRNVGHTEEFLSNSFLNGFLSCVFLNGFSNGFLY